MVLGLLYFLELVDIPDMIVKDLATEAWIKTTISVQAIQASERLRAKLLVSKCHHQLRQIPLRCLSVGSLCLMSHELYSGNLVVHRRVHAVTIHQMSPEAQQQPFSVATLVKPQRAG